jgi:hypothetical protein
MFHDIVMGNKFLDMTPKAQLTKAKNGQMNCIKVFFFNKNPSFWQGNIVNIIKGQTVE